MLGASAESIHAPQEAEQQAALNLLQLSQQSDRPLQVDEENPLHSNAA
jgi:hypothetical protein